MLNKLHSFWLMWGGNSLLNYLSINFIISKLFHYVWNKWKQRGGASKISVSSRLFSELKRSIWKKTKLQCWFHKLHFFPILDQCEQLGLHSEENTRQLSYTHWLPSIAIRIWSAKIIYLHVKFKQTYNIYNVTSRL